MIKVESQSIQMVDPRKLIPHKRNNNKHPLEQKERLKYLIEQNGFRVPIQVSKLSGFITCGHLRHEVALELNMPLVPVIYQDFKNEAMEYAHLTAENEIARWAELDKELVLDTMKEIDIPDINLLGIENFSLLDIEEDSEIDLEEEKEKKYIVEVEFPNDMEMMDLYDDLSAKGYLVKVKK